jgi:phenylpropionate dioxygenase-like ring-hydroxylating dioxygenase large terminal subunit
MLLLLLLFIFIKNNNSFQYNSLIKNTFKTNNLIKTFKKLDILKNQNNDNENNDNIEFINSVSNFVNDTHTQTYINVNETKNIFYNFALFPRLDYPNDKGQLTWYPIGFSHDFGLKPQKITIRDVNYVVWKDKTTYYGLRDCCSHQGSSLIMGDTAKNTISCPYHGYIFDGNNGELVKIPKLQHIESDVYNINCFKVVEKGNMVYLNTVPVYNEEIKNKIDESLIFVEPEFYSNENRVVNLKEDFEHYAKFVTVNSLDICHIGFVHTFGNRKNPNPLHNSKIIKMNDNENHYKIIYEYIAGENSLVNKIYKFENIIVENEYVLPHTTVARVKFGVLSSTIITHALPVSKFKTKLFVKAYRNYWSFNQDTFRPNYFIESLINLFGDLLTKNTMYNTLKQDKCIVDNIDKTCYESMHGKFSIVYDMFSNDYKNNYKKFYEQGNSLI